MGLGKSILIIDDDPEFLFLLKTSLEVFGSYHVTKAEGGKQGARLAQSRRYDIIVSDLIMPDLDGEKVVEAIRASEHNKETPVVVLSGNPDVAVALQMPDVTVFSKPIEPVELVERLGDVWKAKSGATQPH